MMQIPTEEQVRETKECLETVSTRFRMYFNKKKIDYLSTPFVKAIADTIGVKPGIIKACFKGERLTTHTLVKIASCLCISTDYLLGLSDDPSALTTYSDVFYYLKIMIDRGILIPGKYRTQIEMPGPPINVEIDLHAEEPLPTTHMESADQPVFKLDGKFNLLIWQYLQIDGILNHDEEYLQTWRKIARDRLDSTINHGTKAVTSYCHFREIQDNRQISADELQKQLGLASPYMISKYRSGNFPVPSMICKIAKIFNVSSDYLLGLSCNYGRDVSAQDIFDVLIHLCQAQILFRHLHPNCAYEYVVMLNEIFYQFCYLYHQRCLLCTEPERLDFFEQIRHNFSYPLIRQEDMPKYFAINITTPKTSYYMEDCAERIQKYYELYPIKK